MAISLTHPTDRPALKPLRLKVRTGENRGKELLVSAASTTIGSHPDCTVRLRGDGFDPVHCWLLRGENTWLVRQTSPNTRLNGQRFLESRVYQGDRLTLAGVTFEIGENAPTIGGSGSAADLAKWEAEKQQLSEKFAKDAATLESARQELESRCQSLDSARSDAELKVASLQQDMMQLHTLRDEVSQQNHRLVQTIEEIRQAEEVAHQQRDAVQLERDAIEQRLAEQRQQSLELEHQIRELQNQLATAQQAEAASSGSAAELEELQSVLARTQQQVDEALCKLRIQEEREHSLRTENEQANEELQRQLSQIAELQAKLEEANQSREADANKVNEWEERVAKLETERAHAQEVASAAQRDLEQLQTEREELKRQIEALSQTSYQSSVSATDSVNPETSSEESFVDPSEENLEEPEKPVESRRPTAKPKQADDWERNAFAKFRRGEKPGATGKTPSVSSTDDQEATRQSNASFAQAFQGPTPQESILDERQSVVGAFAAGQIFAGHDDEQDTSDEPANQAEVIREASTTSERVPDDAESRLQVPADTPEEDFEEGRNEDPSEFIEPLSAPVSDVAPTSAADVLAKFGISTEEEEPYRPEPISHSREESGYQPASQPPSQPSSQPGVRDRSLETSEDDDGSIEDYMAQLLARVRGDSSSVPLVTPQPIRRETDSKPHVYKEVVEPKPVKVAEPTLKAEEYRPRSQAPEEAMRMAAMRQLANESTRSAIDTSIKRRWRTQAITHGMVGVGGLIAAATSFYTAPTMFSWLTLAGVASIGAGGFFLYRAVGLYQRYQHAMRQIESWKKNNNFADEIE